MPSIGPMSLFGNTPPDRQAVVDGLRPEGADLLVIGRPMHALSMPRTTTREDAVTRARASGRCLAKCARAWVGATSPVENPNNTGLCR